VTADERGQALADAWAEEAGGASGGAGADASGFEKDNARAGAPLKEVIGRRESRQPPANHGDVGAEGAVGRAGARRRLMRGPEGGGRDRDHRAAALPSSARDTEADRRTRQMRPSTR
jgi:hypothetical protein